MNSLAFKILVFLSGLQSIDKQYYQAAQIDATPRWRVFTKITVPLLSPMIAYITITSFIGAFKAYTSVIAVLGGGFGPPIQGKENMLITIVGYIYGKLDNPNLYGIAAAGSLILFGIILLITLVQLQISKNGSIIRRCMQVANPVSKILGNLTKKKKIKRKLRN